MAFLTEAEIWAAERARVAARQGRCSIPLLPPLPLLLLACAIGAATFWSAFHG